MTPAIIHKCHTLILQHNKEKEPSTKEKIRNNIFMEMQPFFSKWIGAILASKNIFWTHKEIVSLGWDCFEFCLKHYKDNSTIPIPNHFYSYTKFYLNMHFTKENKRITQEKNSGPTFLHVPGEDFNNAFMYIEELRAFHEALEPEYKIVFEDAVMSMLANVKDRVRRIDESSLSYTRYSESKKIFKIVVDFLLRR